MIYMRQRSLLNIKSAGSREETKKAVFEFVRKQCSEIQWPTKKRSEGYSDDCFDIADAYVLANAGYIENCVDSIFEFYHVQEAIQDSISKSPLLVDFVKTHIVHFIKKYEKDERLQTIDTLPKEIIEVS